VRLGSETSRAPAGSQSRVRRLATRLRCMAVRMGPQSLTMGLQALRQPSPQQPSEAEAAAARIRARYLSRLGFTGPLQSSASRGRAPLLALEARAGAAAGADAAKPVAAHSLPPELAHGDCRRAFLRTLAYKQVWVPRARRPRNHETLCILDWDDTLLCTSFIEDVRQAGGGRSSKLRGQLRRLGQAAAALLELALQSGPTFIVTNALEGWVESSAADYLPELLPLLPSLQVISARSLYEARFPGQFARWKRCAFFEVRKTVPPHVLVNLVVLGDSRFEISAGVSVGRTFSNTTVKAIKFKEEPTVGELHSQLLFVARRFAEIVGSSQSVVRRLHHGGKFVGSLHTQEGLED